MYQATTEQSRSLREAIADDGSGASLVKVLTKLRKASWEINGETLARIPKPWDAEHPRADLLRYKTLTAALRYTPEPWLHTPEVKKRVTSAWKALAPLNAWLATHT